jgi:uncharacterized membrane-anchored protein
MSQYLFIGLFYILAVGIFAGFSIVLFYHLGKYSMVGDASKRVFAIFMLASLVVIVLAPILILTNNLLS